MILALGALLGEKLLQRRMARWAITFALLASTMFYAERITFLNRATSNYPGATPENGWQRALI